MNTRKNSEAEVESKNEKKTIPIYRKIFLGFCYFQGRSTNFLLLCSQSVQTIFEVASNPELQIMNSIKFLYHLD